MLFLLSSVMIRLNLLREDLTMLLYRIWTQLKSAFKSDIDSSISFAVNSVVNNCIPNGFVIAWLSLTVCLNFRFLFCVMLIEFSLNSTSWVECFVWCFVEWSIFYIKNRIASICSFYCSFKFYSGYLFMHVVYSLSRPLQCSMNTYQKLSTHS